MTDKTGQDWTETNESAEWVCAKSGCGKEEEAEQKWQVQSDIAFLDQHALNLRASTIRVEEKHLFTNSFDKLSL